MKIIFNILLTGFIQLAIAQENPSIQPLIPEILKQFPNVRDFTISSTDDEAYFTVQSPLAELSVIATIKKINNQWSHPEIAAFSGKYNDLESFLSPDELRIYFVSNRPLNKNDSTPKDYDIWYVQRVNKKSDWSEPVNLGAPVNSEYNEFYPSLSLNNNLYFTSDAPASGGKDDIFLCTWENDHYTDPVSLSDSINTAGYEFNAYIAADESFLIFTGYNREDGLGSGDLYISYRKAEVWSKAQNLGKTINSDKMDYCPYVNMRLGTLYFTSKRSAFDTQKEKFSNMNEFLSTINKYENGLSRIYTISFEKFLSK